MSSCFPIVFQCTIIAQVAHAAMEELVSIRLVDSNVLVLNTSLEILVKVNWDVLE